MGNNNQNDAGIGILQLYNSDLGENLYIDSF